MMQSDEHLSTSIALDNIMRKRASRNSVKEVKSNGLGGVQRKLRVNNNEHNWTQEKIGRLSNW